MFMGKNPPLHAIFLQKFPFEILTPILSYIERGENQKNSLPEYHVTLLFIFAKMPCKNFLFYTSFPCSIFKIRSHTPSVESL